MGRFPELAVWQSVARSRTSPLDHQPLEQLAGVLAALAYVIRPAQGCMAKLGPREKRPSSRTNIPNPSNPPVILVVDDDDLVRMMALDTFEDAGFEVLEAENGRHAIEVLKRRPDIKAVLTDVHMPGTPDGIELAR